MLRRFSKNRVMQGRGWWGHVSRAGKSFEAEGIIVTAAAVRKNKGHN